MIGYNRLGINGRFGNQLFQYASLRGIAAKHGYEFCIPPDGTRTANYGMHDPFKLHHLKHILTHLLLHLDHGQCMDLGRCLSLCLFQEKIFLFFL